MKTSKTWRKCKKCSIKIYYKDGYNEKYDAYFCNKCDSWNEDKCRDKGCMFCSGRPEKPSQEMGEI